MPPVRCRFYTENGKPWKGGCRRKDAGCTFIHPDDPRWADAPVPSFRSRDRGRDSTGFMGKAPASTGWDMGGGWNSTGASTSASTSTPPWTSTSAPAAKQSTKSSNIITLVNEWNRTDMGSAESGQVNSSEGGWGGSPHNDGWGAGWGGSASPRNDGWGAKGGWGEASPHNAPGSNAWGSGDSAGGKKDSTSTWAAPEPMDVDQEKPPASKKGKGKVTLAPPRIRIPGNEPEDKPERPLKITGTNNVPIASNRWGSGSAIATTSTPLIATPATTSSPVEPYRPKRKRESDDEKVDAFKEYVKVWERAVRARIMLAEAEDKRDRFFRTQKSPCYSRVGEKGREMLDAQRTECDKEVSSQREKLSAAITSLIQYHDTITSNLDLGQRYNVSEEATKIISEAKAFVDNVRGLLVTQVLEPKNDAPSDDHQPPSSREDDLLTSRSLQRQIRDLDDRLEEAQTELTLRHPRDISAEINEKWNAELADLRAKRQQEVERVALQPRPEIVIPPSALKTMEESTQCVHELDAKIPATVEDIRKLVLRVDAATQRITRLEVEAALSREIFSKMEERAASIQATERRTDEQLKKIETEFEQLTASQPPEPAIPSLPPSFQDKLLEDLRPAFDAALEKFYQREVQPAIQCLGKAVIEASDQHQQDAVGVLWGKIQPAMNTVAGVSRWLDSQDLALTASVETAQHASSI